MDRVKSEYLPNYSYDDYIKWEGKWELINGVPYAMNPAHGIRHQIVSRNIHNELLHLLKDCIKCTALLPVDWRIPGKDDNNVLQPDNLVTCKELKKDYITETPVLIFEILSPSTAFKDRHLKYEIYESKGVKYYVIADGDKNIAEVYELSESKYKKSIDASEQFFKFFLNDDCEINFNFKNIWVQ